MMNQDNSTNRTSRINRYLGLEGSMTSDERDQFESDLDTDMDLRAEYLVTVNLYQLSDRFHADELEVFKTADSKKIFDDLMNLLDESRQSEDGSSETQKRDYSSLINRYLGLDGSMSPEEMTKFESDLDTDMDLRAEYLVTVNLYQLSDRFHADELEVFKTADSERNYQELNTWIQEDRQTEEEEINQMPLNPTISQGDQVDIRANVEQISAAAEPVGTGLGTRFMYWISGVAAVLVIGFFIGKSFLATPEYHFEDLSMEDLTRGSDRTIENLLEEANYVAALNKIETLVKELDEEEQRYLADISIDEAVKADMLLMMQIQRERLWWLKANALLGLQRMKDVLPLLKRLREAESPYYAPLDSIYNALK